MQFLEGNRRIRVFTISPRTVDLRLFWRDVCETIRLSEKYGYSGILIFTGNDTYVDPWLVAQKVLITTTTLSPLVLCPGNTFA